MVKRREILPTHGYKINRRTADVSASQICSKYISILRLGRMYDGIYSMCFWFLSLCVLFPEFKPHYTQS